MSGILNKTQIAICLSTILAFSSSGQCLAQSTVIPLIDTPAQRWLPPPKPFPSEPGSQAKLLSRLREFVLSKDQIQDSDPTRLSNADIQSLKEAMKQFGGNLPDGLSADSLDAIPSDLISKALSNPELLRQAKQLADQFRRIGGPRSNDGPNKSNENADQEPSKRKTDSAESKSQSNAENQYAPVGKGPQSTNPTDNLKLQSKPNSEEFADLMEKLRSTQQQFERNQNQTTEALPSTNPTTPGRSQAAPNKGAPNSGSQSGAKQSGLTPSETVPPPAQTLPNRMTRRPIPTPKGSSPTTDNPFNQRPSQLDRIGQSPDQSRTDSDPFDSKQYQLMEQSKSDESSFLSNAIKDLAIEESLPSNQSSRSASNFSPSNSGSPRNSSASESGDSNSTSSMDIRKELQRRGFGPTLQKLVEEAQRATQSSPASSQPRKGTEIVKPSLPTKTPSENNNKLATPDVSKRPPNPLVTNRSVVDTTPKPPKPDSAMTKSLKESSKYLNNLWTQVSKNDPSSTPPAAPPSSSRPVSSASEPFSLPNPFNANAIECLLVLAVVGVVAFFVLRYRVRSEQGRREILEARMAPRIDEIRTRDDVVRAFHALAKQRLKSAQAWWTYGYVRERFSQTLPEHSGSMRTLSGLYEQARYFPVAHQLTEVQIEDAKLALKQCKG